MRRGRCGYRGDCVMMVCEECVKGFGGVVYFVKMA